MFTMSRLNSWQDLRSEVKNRLPPSFTSAHLANGKLNGFANTQDAGLANKEFQEALKL